MGNTYDVEDGIEYQLAPDGTPWWKLRLVPGRRRKFGGEKRLAAYLWFKKNTGDTFTMRELRAELGEEEEPEDAEHLNRRLRALRPDGWLIQAKKDDRRLPQDTYRLVTKGRRVWLGERNKRPAISAKTRRFVLDRDGNRCTVCGIGANEIYFDLVDIRATMTVGHRIPVNRGGSADPENLRTECTRCNEPVRDHMPNPETFEEVLPEIRELRQKDLRTLITWLTAGERPRPKVDRVYDRVRQLSDSEKRDVISAIEAILGEG